jgi:hypothetical protein
LYETDSEIEAMNSIFAIERFEGVSESSSGEVISRRYQISQFRQDNQSFYRGHPLTGILHSIFIGDVFNFYIQRETLSEEFYVQYSLVDVKNFYSHKVKSVPTSQKRGNTLGEYPATKAHFDFLRQTNSIFPASSNRRSDSNLS